MEEEPRLWLHPATHTWYADVKDMGQRTALEESMRLHIGRLGMALWVVCGLYAGVSAYVYTGNGVTPDVAWFPLGNGQGHLTAVENPVGLPIITTMRTPGSGRSVVNGQTTLTLSYVTTTLIPPFNRLANWSPAQVCFSDGMQPVVSYTKAAATQVVWPMDMTPVSRQWIEEANMLRTVIGNTDFELAVEDFVCSDRDVLVRVLRVKNLMTAASPFRLFHFAPINPSGRDMSPWVTGWQNFQATNSCSYDAGGDCVLYTANNSDWWVMGADRASSGHQCGAYQTVVSDIADGALGGSTSAGPAVVEAALSFDMGTLNQGDSATVAVYVLPISGATAQQAVSRYTSACKGANTAAGLRTTTLSFWRTWLAAGRSAGVADAGARTLVRRLLTVLKACTWDIGGISAVPGELAPFYTRDAMGPARALMLWGYPSEAKRILLALEAYLTTSGTLNFQSYDPAISQRITQGFTDATTFSDITQFSADDPALIVYTIGEIWHLSGNTDTAFVRQAWPFVKHLVSLGQRDMGAMGTIGQNSGFQDDMLHWAFQRPGSGVECSFINMIWVAALQYAANIGTALGDGTRATQYTTLAASIRSNIENRFWSASRQEYAYIHVPDSRDLGRTDFTAVDDGSGGRYIFPDTRLAMGESMPYWVAYAADAHARHSLDLAKAAISLPAGDLVRANYGTATQNLTTTFYAEAAARDTSLAGTEAWFVKNIPLAGAPESMMTGNRSVQVWMTGETLVALYGYVEASGGLTGVRPSDGRSRLSVAPRSAVTPGAVWICDLAGRMLLPGLKPTAAGCVLRVNNATGGAVSQSLLVPRR
jgi:hypothetical protein